MDVDCMVTIKAEVGRAVKTEVECFPAHLFRATESEWLRFNRGDLCWEAGQLMEWR